MIADDKKIAIEPAPITMRLLAAILLAIAGAAQDITPVVFVHLPKTAGTSLRGAFKRKWNAAGCMQLDIHTATQVETPLYLRQHTGDCYWADLRENPDPDDKPKFVRGVLDGKIPPMTYLIGHVPHGYCTFMRGGCRYMTVLREPMRRIMSHYYFIKDRYPEFLNSVCRNCTTIDRFAEEVAAGRAQDPFFENMQTRYIAGEAFFAGMTSGPCVRGLGMCDIHSKTSQEMLEVAKANLRSYMDVGIAEDLPSFAARNGLQLHHVNKGINYKKKLAPETKRVLRKTQDLDLQLYNLAKQLSAQHAERANSLYSSG